MKQKTEILEKYAEIVDCLDDAENEADNVCAYASDAQDNASNAESYAADASSQAGSAMDKAEELSADIAVIKSKLEILAKLLKENKIINLEGGDK